MLCASGDVAGLIEAAVNLLLDEGRRERLVAAARQDMEDRFSWPHLAGIAEVLYLDELEQKSVAQDGRS